MSTSEYAPKLKTPPDKKNDAISANSSIINLKQTVAAPMTKAFDIGQNVNFQPESRVSDSSL